MAQLYGTANAYGVPVTVEFSFNGASTPWGTANLYSMAPLTNRAESVDGGYEISSLSVELTDTDGSIWGSLGHGTTCFNKEFSATVYIGGTMEYSAYGPSGGQKWKLQNRNQSATYTVHQGKITEVSRRNRLVRIMSQNNLRNIGDLEWRFPYTTESVTPDAVVGSYYFFNSKRLGTLFPNSLILADQDQDQFEFYAAVATSVVALTSAYPSIVGRGTLGLVSGYTYPGTQLYFDLPRVKVRGTFLGVKFGTINSLEEANRFGYADLAAAEAGRINGGVTGPAGTYYNINKSRLHINNGTNAVGSQFHFQQNIVLTESPANLFRELLCGHCVTPYFGTTDLDPTTFSNAQLMTGFQAFTYKPDPKGGKVVDAIKNLMESMYGLFAVNTSNKFEFRPYAPRKIRVTPPSLGSSDVFEASVENSIKDYYNRVALSYGYDFDSGEFRRKYEIKDASWTHTLDRPYVVDSRFITNENEAVVFTNRLLRRFKNTVPRFSITTSLKHSGVAIGSLFSLQDTDTLTGTKIVEVVGYSKDFADTRKVDLEAIDAEALYFRRGYAYWGTKVTLPGDAVNSNSDSGWGTGGTNGTCPGINTTIHGTSSFIWW